LTRCARWRRIRWIIWSCRADRGAHRAAAADDGIHVIGIGASYLVGVHLLGIEPTYLWVNMLKYTHDVDVVMGCQGVHLRRHHRAHRLLQRLTCGLGAEGVGRATTEAVVYSSITILITNFFLTLTLGKLVRHRAIMIEVRDLKKSFGAQLSWTA
jgi:hypothetical protein